ncbi:MAG: bifunctional folylpolyglutamate synthase/dihydrofolate synthase [Acidimicrobiia bacterium]
MNLPEALTWLTAHVNLETGRGVPAGVDRRKTAPTLDRIRALTDLLGSPQLLFPSVHLTGTNGKTSATRMIAALLDTLGLSTGSYTSPDLTRVNERMALRGEPIGDDDLAAVLSRVAAVEEFVRDRPSYFEILTAAAFDWFAQEAVDVAVVEVGVGGTWDATSIVDAPVAVVTNVSIDHVEYLGSTLLEIATEKSGIVQPGATLVLGETDEELLECFEARAPREILLRDRDFSVRSQRLAHGGRVLDLVTPTGPYDEVYLPLHGAHQADNAVIALTAAEAFLGERIPQQLVDEAFAGLRSPGRLEVVGRQPLLLLDGAHNVAGAHALLIALNEEFATGPRTLVVGLLREKEPHEMLEALGIASSGHLVCTRAPSPRALDPMEVANAAVDLGFDGDQIDIVDSVPDAVARALDVTPADGQVIVTGSLYTVGAARSVLVPHA